MLYMKFTVFIWLLLTDNAMCNLSASKMTNVLKQVLTGYERHIAPVEADSPVNIYVQLVFSDMFPYTAVDMHYSADFYMKMIWYDYRLAYNKSDNVSAIPLRDNKLWKPDIYFPMAKKGSLHDVPDVNEGSMLFLNGTVSHSQRINLMSYCPMELKYYPFDIQHCDFEITTFVDNKDFVRLNWNQIPIIKERGKLVMKDFNIVKYDVIKTTSSAGRQGDFDSLVIKFSFYRYFVLYFLRDFFPCILIVLLSWITFWIDYSSTPARVAMGITTVLTIVTMTNSIRNNSPPAGLFRSLDYYLLMCNLFVFAALAEYAVVGLTDGTRRNKRKKKENCNEIMAESKGFCNFNHISLEILNHETNSKEEKHKNRDIEIASVDFRKHSHYIDRISRFLFPSLFASLNIIYFVYHRLNKNTVD